MSEETFPVYPRAMRRWQRQKRQAHLVKRAHRWGMDEHEVLRYARRYTNARHPCSCYMCCNRRKNEGATRQERLTTQSQSEDMAEWVTEQARLKSPILRYQDGPHYSLCYCHDCRELDAMEWFWDDPDGQVVW